MAVAVQQLQDSTLHAGGNLTILNLVVNTQSYYQRAIQSTSRSLGPGSPTERMAELSIQARHLQKTTKELSRELRLTVSPPTNYDDLSTTLDEIADEVIPSIFRFSVQLFQHQLNEIREFKVLVEIAYMQRILDDFKFSSRRAAEYYSRGPDLIFKAKRLLGLLLGQRYPRRSIRRLVVVTRESLIASRVKIYATLFEMMNASLASPVCIHHTEILDFFGAQWYLPRDLCQNRQAFSAILHLKFQGSPAEIFVALGQFGVFQRGGIRPVQVMEWENTIKEGHDLQLSVLLNQQSTTMMDKSQGKCPQCRKADKVFPDRSRDGWADCLRCNSTFNMTPLDLEALEKDDVELSLGQDSSRNESRFPQSSLQPFRHLTSFLPVIRESSMDIDDSDSSFDDTKEDPPIPDSPVLKSADDPLQFPTRWSGDSESEILFAKNPGYTAEDESTYDISWDQLSSGRGNWAYRAQLDELLDRPLTPISPASSGPPSLPPTPNNFDAFPENRGPGAQRKGLTIDTNISSQLPFYDPDATLDGGNSPTTSIMQTAIENDIYPSSFFYTCAVDDTKTSLAGLHVPMDTPMNDEEMNSPTFCHWDITGSDVSSPSIYSSKPSSVYGEDMSFTRSQTPSPDVWTGYETRVQRQTPHSSQPSPSSMTDVVPSLRLDLKTEFGNFT